MRSARIGADAAHPRARTLVLYPGLLRRIPDLPPALVIELIAHEGDDVLEGDPGLFE